MPLRVYDISKKLGLENKVVLAKARALGLTAARVASSTLDKITAEYLELEIIKDHPELTAPPPPAPIPAIVTSLRQPEALVTAKETTKDITQSAVPLKSPAALQQPTQPRSIPVVRELAHGRTFETSSQRFERRVRQIIDQHHPFCALSNILLFHGERARFSAVSNQDGNWSDYAFELDHLLHRATDTKDVLTIVECKNQPIAVRDEQTWEVVYMDPTFPNDPKRAHNVQEQVARHAKALRAYVNPLSRGRLLQVEAIVVSSDEATPTRERQVAPWLKIYLMSEKTLMLAITMLKPSALRVVQSDLLGLLRLGITVPELGHPELPNALAYIERCRRDLDVELFRAFEPTKERWAINGSAGMGKSVLLAYSLFVLTTDRKIQIQGENKTLVNFATEAANLNLPPLGQRGVYAFALKEKQRQVIEVLFRRFVDEFSRLSKDSDLGIRRTAIRLWTGKIPEDCHVLVLDEAHDLSAAYAKLIADWVNAAGQNRYILIACDRHQKLRLVGRDENIIDGISFRLKTKKLRLNYRNPFAVYSASLGLMFRWFAKNGPKVVPTRDDLQSGFGFSVEQDPADDSITLSMRNDAHPANSWSDCVSIFPSCGAALARLRPCRFQPQDVLWVRFNDEDEHFDYEQLSCYTYHNLNSAESVELADKYIKGQDFPIVVIEGFSEDMNAWDSPEKEQRMWQRRKELYVCSSRATAFLFFVSRAGSGDDAKMREEVQELVRQLSSPHREKGRTWRCRISQTSERRRMDVFSDAQEDQKASTAG